MSEQVHVNIDTSNFEVDFNEIKKEIIDFRPGYSKIKTTYPNGFWFVAELDSGTASIEINPEWLLIKKSDVTLVPQKK